MPVHLSAITSYQGLKATVLGLGTFGGGAAVARFLSERGALVTVTDLRDEETLKLSLKELADVPLTAVHLGSHPEQAFSGADLVVVNPAVKPSSAISQQFGDAIVTSEMELFLKHNSGSVIGVTGSNGKSTTAALIRQLLKPHVKQQGRSVWLGGNIGNSLLPQVEDIHRDDIVVLELSSFQLHYLADSGFAPRVAVVTNFAPNHLDWHPSLDHYQKSKQVLLRRQQRDDFAILSDGLVDELSTAGTPTWRVRGKQLRFGHADHGEDGAFFENGSLVLRHGKLEDAVRIDQPVSLPGQHNRDNIAAAACAAWCMGAAADEFAAVLARYEGLPHRLQLVGNGRDRRFYNDSLATTPESAIAALNSFSQPRVILAGGSDKGVDLSALAKAIHEQATAAVLIGATAHNLVQQLSELTAENPGPSIHVAEDFAQAFSLAVEVAPQGSIVLLSPGCASYGWFRDFRDRGEQFTQLAQQWLLQ